MAICVSIFRRLRRPPHRRYALQLSPASSTRHVPPRIWDIASGSNVNRFGHQEDASFRYEAEGAVYRSA